MDFFFYINRISINTSTYIDKKAVFVNICQTILLSFINAVNHPKVSLVCLPYCKKYLGRDAKEIDQLIRHPAWEARWIAAQKVHTAYCAEDAWKKLCVLAEDPVRYVREGAAQGLAFLIARYAFMKDLYKQTLQDARVSQRVRRAILYSVVVLWRRHPDRIKVAIDLLTTAAALPPEGCLRVIGARLVAVELRRSHPHVTRDLVRRWRQSGNQYLQYHAKRAEKNFRA